MQQLDHRVLTARLTTHRTVRLEANCRTTGDRQALEYSAGRCPGSESLRARNGFLPPDMTRTRARKSRMFVEIARSVVWVCLGKMPTTRRNARGRVLRAGSEVVSAVPPVMT